MQKISSIFRITLFVVLGLGAVGTVYAQEFITNGSLTGPIANGNVPPDWTILAGSPDTMDENNNVGVAGLPFGADPTGPSPDGGTWVGFARGNADSGFQEIFGQTVTGLTVGTVYEISWYAGNFGAVTGPGYTADNSIAVSLDGALIGSGSLLTLGPDWVSESVSFTATSTSHQISFGLMSDGESYLSMDGISLTVGSAAAPLPSKPVPTLSQFALIALILLLGSVGLYGLRGMKP